MRSTTFANRIAFLLTLLTAMVAGITAARFPRPADAHSGPGGFPLFLAVVMALLALSGIALSQRMVLPESSETGNGGSSPWRLPLLTLAIIFYLVFMPILGFISSTALMCAVTLWILGYRDAVRALAAGCIAAFALYGVFGVIMNVVLPRGWIG